MKAGGGAGGGGVGTAAVGAGDAGAGAWFVSDAADGSASGGGGGTSVASACGTSHAVTETMRVSAISPSSNPSLRRARTP